MIDVSTNKPLRVSILSDPGGGIMRVAVSQLPDIQRVLDENKVIYWVQGGSYSYDGGPWKTVIQISANDDAGRVRTLLDNIS